MPRYEQHLLQEYITLLRNRNNASSALEAQQTTINTQTGLMKNFFNGQNPKYKAQYESRMAGMPVEQRMDFRSYLARDIANASAAIDLAKAEKVEWQKHLASCEQALSRFVTTNPGIGQLSFDSALALVSQDPSADPSPTETHAEAAASELHAARNTEEVASRNS